MSDTQKDFERVTRFLYDLGQLAIELKQSDFNKEQFTKTFENWKKDELPEIFETAGENIGLPFREKKLDARGWQERRLFPAPFYDLQGVWSGETYRALFDEKMVGDTIGIFKHITNNKLEYGYKAGEKTRYINVNLGISEGFLNQEVNRISEVIINKVKDIRSKYLL